MPSEPEPLPQGATHEPAPARARQVADLRGGPGGPGPQETRPEVERAGGDGHDHGRVEGGAPGREDRGRDPESGAEDPQAGRRDGGRPGDDRDDPGRADLPRRQQTGDRPSTDPVTPQRSHNMVPGEYVFDGADIELNANRPVV